jgi:hypothetical protein
VNTERERAENHLALMKAMEPKGMVIEPHICCFSDWLSISARDVIALAEQLARCRQTLREVCEQGPIHPDLIERELNAE